MADPTEGELPKSNNSKAVQTLAQLRKRWGSEVGLGVPDVIDISGMSTELWLRKSDGSNGEATNYALEREWQP